MFQGTNSISNTYELLKWLLPTVSKFPKDKRYTLGSRIENKVLDILELLIKATYTKPRLELLKKANIDLEILRHMVRLSYDLKLINLPRYEYLSEQINEIGKSVGGWIKLN